MLCCLAPPSSLVLLCAVLWAPLRTAPWRASSVLSPVGGCPGGGMPLSSSRAAQTRTCRRSAAVAVAPAPPLLSAGPDGELRSRCERLEKEAAIQRNRAEVNSLFREEHDRRALLLCVCVWGVGGGGGRPPPPGGARAGRFGLAAAGAALPAMADAGCLAWAACAAMAGCMGEKGCVRGFV
jgi:hypothetical protein